MDIIHLNRPCRHRFRPPGKTALLFAWIVTSKNDVTVSNQKGVMSLDLYDLAAAEKAESQIDQFINKRARENDEQRRVEAAWAESARRYHARRQERNRAEWREFHLGQASSIERTAAELAASHRSKAEALESGQTTSTETEEA